MKSKFFALIRGYLRFSKAARWILLLLVSSSIFNIYNHFQEFYYPQNVLKFAKWSKKTNEKYLISTPSCKIWDMNPFDPAVRKYFHPGLKLAPCKPIPLKLTNTFLGYNEMHRYDKNTTCCYRSITRISQSPKKYTRLADSLIRISKDCITVPKAGLELDPSAQYIKIECSTSSGNLTDYMAVTFPPQSFTTKTKKKFEYWRAARLQAKESNAPFREPPSILLLGLDSVSRLQSIRAMPRAREFLRANHFTEMKGYTKVGPNTFPNAMAFLGGMEFEKWPCYRNWKKLDDCPLIWKNFSKHHYLTAKFEDIPDFTTFNFKKAGFVEQPVDYYYRPFALASKEKDRDCVEGATKTMHLINKINEFVEVAGHVPYFLLTWITEISHNSLNNLTVYEPFFMDLISRVLKSPRGNSTVIVFFSDHGRITGPFRETWVGYYEESLPFFFIRLPPPLKESHPSWYQNLLLNSERLTSPLDLHATLEDILSLSSPNALNYTHGNGIPDLARKVFSLLEETPLSRTCISSGIPDEFCRCGVDPTTKEQNIGGGRFKTLILRSINHYLRYAIKRKLCVRRSFKKLVYVRRLLGYDPSVNGTKPKVDYLVGLAANPRNSRFEATIRSFSNGALVLVGDIRLLSSYANQSDCVDNIKLKQYCICRDWHQKH